MITSKYPNDSNLFMTDLLGTPRHLGGSHASDMTAGFLTTPDSRCRFAPEWQKTRALENADWELRISGVLAGSGYVPERTDGPIGETTERVQWRAPEGTGGHRRRIGCSRRGE